jgi:hypothetical protein
MGAAVEFTGVRRAMSAFVQIATIKIMTDGQAKCLAITRVLGAYDDWCDRMEDGENPWRSVWFALSEPPGGEVPTLPRRAAGSRHVQITKHALEHRIVSKRRQRDLVASTVL